jgi:uncharacterized protein
VLEAIERLNAHPKGSALFSGLLSVIDLESDPTEVYAFFKAVGAPSVDFLYRDGNHDNLPTGKGGALSTEYGDWMVGLLDVYLADPTPIRIRILDDMLRLLLGGRSVKEGIGKDDYGILVVETNGAITKNDTLKSANGSEEFEQSWTVADDFCELVATAPFIEYHRAQQPSAAVCLSCRDLGVCGGGMPTHRWSAARGLDNPSVFCADQKQLIAQMRGQIARRLAA